jgi:uncharacterized protein with HEPN domain
VTRRPEELLRDAMAHFELMQDYAQRDLSEQLVVDAVCLRLSAGIEALAGLDAERREDLFGHSWPLMWGMRNRIAHGYLLVAADIVRRTLEVDIPPIIESIRRALS